MTVEVGKARTSAFINARNRKARGPRASRKRLQQVLDGHTYNKEKRTNVE